MNWFEIVSKLILFIFEILKSCWRRAKNAKELAASREDLTLFASGSQLHLCLSHIQYKPSIASAGLGLERILRHAAGTIQWTKLFLMQASMAHILSILESNKIFKGCVNQTLSDCNRARNYRGRDSISSTLGTNAWCLVTALAWKILWAEKNWWGERRIFEKRREKNIIKVGSHRKFRCISCFSFKINAINFFEIRAEATHNVLVELLEKRPRRLDATLLWMSIIGSQTTLHVAI